MDKPQGDEKANYRSAHKQDGKDRPILYGATGHRMEANSAETDTKGKHNKAKPFWRRSKFWQAFQSLSGVVMLVVTAILACFAVRQWQAMRDQAKTMNDTLLEIRKQTAAARKASAAAETALELTRADQRPYVVRSMTKVEDPLNLGPSAANTSFTNIGHTSAFNVRLSGCMVMIPEHLSRSPNKTVDAMFTSVYKRIGEGHGIDLAPQEGAWITTVITDVSCLPLFKDIEDRRKMTATDLASYRDNRTVLVLISVAVYFDAYSKVPHKTETCTRNSIR